MSREIRGLWKGVVIGSAVFLLLIAWVVPEISGGTLQRRLSKREKRVNELYNRNCARCHGADGRGDTPLGRTFSAPNFTDPEWWTKNPKLSHPRTMRAVIVRGKGGMPAFGKKLTSSEINLLVGRMRSFRNLPKTIAR